MTSAAKYGGTTMYFDYDGLNRQVSRRIGTSGTRTFSVWDGWNLIEEYQSAGGGATTAAYLYGATGLISGVTNGQFAYYFQDGSGSTSHLTDANGNLLEWYRYDLQGTPIFYNASDQQISASAYGVSYLFTGQQWRNELGLYDLRNRFYSPNIGRFLQPDPIGFRGDRTNLYRYCGNNPVTRWDPSGLQQDHPVDASSEPVIVEWRDTPPPIDNPSDHPSFNPMPGFGPFGSPTGGSPFRGIGPYDFGPYQFFAPKKVGARQGNGQHQQTAPPPSAPPPQNPPQQNPSSSNGAPGSAAPVIKGGVFPGTASVVPGGTRLGDIYDYERLRKMLVKSGPSPRDAASMRSFADAINVSATIYVGGTLAGGVVFELAGPALAAGPGALGESIQSAIYSSRLTSAKVLVGVQGMTMGITSTAYKPINEEVLMLLEEEMVPWQYWRP